jgi:sortase A
VLVEATTTAPPTTTAVLAAPAAAAAPTSQPSGLPVPQAPPDPRAKEAVVELGTIQIPRLGLNKPFYEGVTLATLNRGPGHWPGTALPGTVGNVVLGGHRTSKGRPFRHLEQLMPGDEVIFTTGAGQFLYRVTRTEIVTPESMWIINQTEAYTATLFACHPVGSTKERIVVFLELSV